MSFAWPWEIDINIFLQQLGSWLSLPMKAFSFMGTEYFFLVALTVIYWCWDSRLGLRVGLSLMFGNLVNAYFKTAFHGARPYWFDNRVQGLSSESSFGFPSGHAQLATMVWGRMAAWFKKTWVTIVVVIIVFMIGLSRLYLGVHFFTDVVGGWLIGAGLLWLMVKLESPFLRWWQNKKLTFKMLFALVVSLAGIVIGLAIIFAAPNWQMPADWLNNAVAADPTTVPNPLDPEGLFTIGGTLFGLITGASWMEVRGGFSARGRLSHKVIRYLIGLVGIGVIWFGLGQILPDDPNLFCYTLRYLRYALLGLWVSAFAPMIFVKLKIAKQKA
ncbi:MAG TPA: phosphatase PAP2 family protein [Longilinea sp.]|nr:phosphatase PAP2 family protein [Longilinea sp.]